MLLQTSCKKDDDNDIGSNSLANTVWKGERSDDGTYTFINNSEYSFYEPGDSRPVEGTYTFDGKDGTIEEFGETFPFSVSGITMTMFFNETNTGIYIKQ
ncbi:MULTISPECIES: hypothetical protein [Aequorivita]|uniref:Lipocalin-like domain-containing protein n=1 Tax=Aequorivita iocasae TaxID=2803865 RepID=A0ABX7DR92_9FLAO|nr:MULTISPECIES: hypothetical protein [Aequorivita]QQX75977.1 hypothetical protein JK629_11615 [Aequorivita iocasae]UCA55438.1 hypothetical protein LDL78_11670 [Aequorivita sp. F7]